MAKLDKPSAIESDHVASRKWDELTGERDFSPSQAPLLVALCGICAANERAIDDLMDEDGQIRVSYFDDMGVLKEFPQVGIMLKTSSEIRQLNKQLGINDEAHAEARPKETKLYAIQGNRRARAANKGSAAAR